MIGACNPLREVGNITSKLEKIGEAINRLVDAVNAIEEKSRPVSTPRHYDESGARDPVPVSLMSPVALDLDAKADEIDELARRIQSICRNIELS